MKIYILGTIVACILSGCGTMTFRHPYKDSQQFNQDWTDCEAKAGAAGYSGGLYRRNFMERCMAGGGWERE